MKSILSILLSLAALAAVAGEEEWAHQNDTLNYGVIGKWTLNESRGTNANDISGYSNNGTFTNSPTWTNGLIGGALYFDGNGAAVGCGPIPPITSLTVSAWIKISQAPSSYTEIVDMENLHGFSLILFSDRKIQWYLGSGGSFTGVTNASTVVPFNSWTHVCATFNGSVAKVFVNGQQTGSTTAAVMTWTNAPLQIGRRLFGGTADRFFIGTIDNVTIWNRALTNEVQLLYNGGYGTP